MSIDMGELDFFVVCFHFYVRIYVCMYFCSKAEILPVCHKFSLSSEYCVCFINLIFELPLGFTMTLKVQVYNKL